MRSLYRTLVASAALGLSGTRSQAQLFASEPATVSQTVDGTKITVEYSRPRARGRTGLFGTRMHPGETWTPGANQATTLTLSKGVAIEGIAVPKGKYSVWLFLAKAPGRWELLLDPDTMLFHTQSPQSRSQQIRLSVQRESRAFMEVLTWWFPAVSTTGATLAMQWDTVYVPLRLTVTPTYSMKTSAAQAQRIAGRYRVRNEPPPGPLDTSAAAEEQPARELTFTIRYEAGELRGVMDPPLFTTERGYTHWVLIPVRADWYYLGRFDEGELVEVQDFAALQFAVSGGRATGFELRAKNDALFATGKRLP